MLLVMSSIKSIFEEVSFVNTYFKEQLKVAASDLKRRNVCETSSGNVSKASKQRCRKIFLESLSSIAKSLFTTTKWFFRIALISTIKIFYSFHYWSNSLSKIVFGTVVDRTSSSVKKVVLFFKRCLIFYTQLR